MEFKSFHSSSSGNLYSVRSGDSTLLIEAGLPVQKIKQSLNFKLGEVSGCLISHSHL